VGGVGNFSRGIGPASREGGGSRGALDRPIWLDDSDAGESQLAPSRPGWLDAMDDEAELMTIISDGSSDEGDVVRTREMQDNVDAEGKLINGAMYYGEGFGWVD
jgi:hypothetical protein